MKKRTLIMLALILSLLFPCTAFADTADSKNTGIKYCISYADSRSRPFRIYVNWDSVSNVSQFADADGNYCFACNESETVVIVRTKDGKPLKKKITLKKKYPLFGGVTCDSKGNYYLVSARYGDGDDTKAETVFISKYNKKGTLIKTIGDNGSSSLGRGYGSSCNTYNPFDGGNCSLAINGNYLVVNYARVMYNGHQSNSVLAINTTTMEKVNLGEIYSSHSFAQRAVPHNDGFLLASEGDGYSRAFTVTTIANMTAGACKNDDIFHFWVRKNALKDYDMLALNDNFAHMGNLVSINKNTAALVAISAKSLDQKAKTEKEQLFIQIFDPSKPLNSASAYTTSGTRSGLSGGNGNQQVKNYGVKWLTNYKKYFPILPQAVVTGDGKIVILYELYDGKNGRKSNYMGLYYMVLDQNGNVVTDKTKYSSDAHLNSYEMPICSDNTIYWNGNEENDDEYNMYIYSLTID